MSELQYALQRKFRPVADMKKVIGLLMTFSRLKGALNTSQVLGALH